jgi:CrcB protein
MPLRSIHWFFLQNRQDEGIMSLLHMVYIVIGGGIGAGLRFLVMSLIGHYFGDDFPYSTLFVNVSGSFLMGLLIGILTEILPESAPAIRLFLAVGVLGGYTTFSTFSLDCITLLERGAELYTAVYILLSIALSLAALILGLHSTRLFWQT